MTISERKARIDEYQKCINEDARNIMTANANFAKGIAALGTDALNAEFLAAHLRSIRADAVDIDLCVTLIRKTLKG